MKKYLILLCCCWTKAPAQSVSVRQLAALVQYAREGKQGYQAVQQGLTHIRSLTGAEYALHQLFFAGLAGINPKLFAYVQVHPPLSTQSGH